MSKQLTKGNEAIVKAAVLAGCRAFYGYPITPASEIAEAAARYLPLAGGVFVQAESEVAAVNMLYGGAAAGVRAMSASSGPGISLMQEGSLHCRPEPPSSRISAVVRLSNIAPEQTITTRSSKAAGTLRDLVVLIPSGNGRPHHLGLRSPIGTATRRRSRRRLHQPDDGACRVRRPRFPCLRPRLGRCGVQLHAESGQLDLPGPDHLERHIRKLENASTPHGTSSAPSLAHRDADFILVRYGIVGHPQGRRELARPQVPPATPRSRSTRSLPRKSAPSPARPRASPSSNSVPDRWSTMSASPSKAVSRSNSSAEPAAMPLPPKTSSPFCLKNGAGQRPASK